jgi:hypothetical protein
MTVKAEDQRAAFTIKVSTVVREHIEKSTNIIEPVDRTLRRLFGLPVQPGEFPSKPVQKKKVVKGKKKVIWTTIKVTEVVRDHITSKAEWNRSVDHTLRRLFKLPIEENGR